MTRPLEPQLVNEQATIHMLPSRIQHWQLRNLMCCSDDEPHKLYVVFRNHIVCYDTETQNSMVALTLDYAATCIDCRHGYLATGGQFAELTIKNLRTDSISQHRRDSGACNNALAIHKHKDGTVRLYLSSNEDCVTSFVLEGGGGVLTNAFPVAINNTAISPDDRYMVAVGDCDTVFLHEWRDGLWELVRELRGGDSGMSCAWNPSSTRFAVASQDGSVIVWEVPSMTRVFSTTSQQHPDMMGAVRCVKFAQMHAIDLLVYSEHTNIVHVIDTREWDEQTLSLRVADTNVNISGLCFSTDCRYVYVSTSKQMHQFTVNSMLRRAFPSGSLL